MRPLGAVGPEASRVANHLLAARAELSFCEFILFLRSELHAETCLSFRADHLIDLDLISSFSQLDAASSLKLLMDASTKHQQQQLQQLQLQTAIDQL